MLSKQEQKEKNEQFWGDFKTYMRKSMSSSGRRVNWLSYPTQTKDLYVRLHADGKLTAVYFDIQCKDSGVREVIWEQMGELRAVLRAEMGDEGEWIEEFHTLDGRTISRIQWTRPELNYYRESDIPLIYSFFKETLINFDRFYVEYSDILIHLLD